jgi:hypothetical protein
MTLVYLRSSAAFTRCTHTPPMRAFISHRGVGMNARTQDARTTKTALPPSLKNPRQMHAPIPRGEVMSDTDLDLDLEFIPASVWCATPPPPRKIRVLKTGVYLPTNTLTHPPERWRFTYPIRWEQVDTPAKLLRVVWHLTEKTEWVDAQLLGDLIEIVDRHFDFRVRGF